MLELLSLLGILEGQGVEVLRASDLELDQRGLLALLDPGGCCSGCIRSKLPHDFVVVGRVSVSSKRTGGILPAADLDELS